MGVYNNNKDGTRSTLANTIQVVDAPMEQFVSRGEFSAVTPNDVSADNKLVAENEVTKAVSTIPTASADLVGTIVQYVGTTTANYTNGYFYKCVSDGAITPTYSWEEVISGGSDVSNKMDKENPTGTGSFSLNRKANTTVGNYSVTEGYEGEASGDNSHAEGIQTTASGDSSHAEGYETTANGDDSHAEGSETIASDFCSHAEGTQTTASGQASHAEGGGTKANGNGSHAEGMGTIAIGIVSHAEGGITTANGDGSHTEGRRSVANGPASHAEGGTFDFDDDNPSELGLYEYNEDNETYIKTTDTSFAEDKDYYFPPTELTEAYIHTFPPNVNPSDEGWMEQQSEGVYIPTQDTTVNIFKTYYDFTSMAYIGMYDGMQHNANGWFSHVEGFNNIAVECSHAEGCNTKACGSTSHAEGYSTITSGLNSHAEGTQTTASGYCAHTEGKNTTASGYYSHAQNESTIAQGRSQTTIGKYNVTQGTMSSASSTDYALIIGNGTDANTRSNALAIQWDGTIVFANGETLTPAQITQLKALLS